MGYYFQFKTSSQIDSYVGFIVRGLVESAVRSLPGWKGANFGAFVSL